MISGGRRSAEASRRAAIARISENEVAELTGGGGGGVVQRDLLRLSHGVYRNVLKDGFFGGGGGGVIPSIGTPRARSSVATRPRGL